MLPAAGAGDHSRTKARARYLCGYAVINDDFGRKWRGSVLEPGTW